MPIQEGIYYRQEQRPGCSFAILFFRAQPEATAQSVSVALTALWQMYANLKAGSVRDLPNHPVPANNLSTLLGFGTKAFSLKGAARTAPEALSLSFRSPLPTGGGQLLVGSGLSYDPTVSDNLATEEFAVQFIADNDLSVYRAIVETWKMERDGLLPSLQMGAFYTGFQRDDGRSWIDFHDGVNNLRSDERDGVIRIAASGDPKETWTVDGTYLAFIRVSVDLASWRGIVQERQSTVVGRDKLTGCPLTAISAGSGLVVAAGCPPAGKNEFDDQFRDASAAVDATVALSHIQRANHRLGPPDDPGSARVYRQGFEFFERDAAAPGFRAGLNFVSFINTPERLTKVLTTATWLGSTNFGGEINQDGGLQLLSVLAAGVYFVPPTEAGFPGRSALTS